MYPGRQRLVQPLQSCITIGQVQQSRQDWGGAFGMQPVQGPEQTPNGLGVPLHYLLPEPQQCAWQLWPLGAKDRKCGFHVFPGCSYSGWPFIGLQSIDSFQQRYQLTQQNSVFERVFQEVSTPMSQEVPEVEFSQPGPHFALHFPGTGLGQGGEGLSTEALGH